MCQMEIAEVRNELAMFIDGWTRAPRKILTGAIPNGAKRNQTGIRQNQTKKPPEGGVFVSGAQERTRTSTVLPPLGPEPSASTNFATWAGCFACRSCACSAFDLQRRPQL